MTLPDERYHAVVNTEFFLRSLTDPKITPRVPRLVRDRARSLLRHYPDQHDMIITSQYAPMVFQQKMEDLTRFVMKGTDK